MGKKKLQRKAERIRNKKLGGGLQRKILAAWAAYREGNHQQAAVLCQEVLEKSPQHEDALLLHDLLGSNQDANAFKEAIAAHQQGNLQQAGLLYEKVLSSHPNDSNALHGFGVLQRGLGDLEKAESLLTRAIEINPNQSHFYYNLGNVYLDQKKLDEAIEAFNQSVSVGNPFPEAYTSLAAAFHGKDDLEKAAFYGERALQLDPNFFRAHNNLCAVLTEQGEIEKAIQHGSTAIKLAPNFVDAYVNLGGALRESGNLNQGRQVLERAIELSSSSAEAHNNLSIVYREMGLYKKAFDHCEIAESLAPGYLDAQNNMGALLFNQGYYDDAMARFEEILRHFPDSADAQYNKSKVHLLRGEYQAGWKLYESRFTKSSPVRLSRENQTDISRDEIVGKSVLVLAEQGLGDEIVHGTFFADVINDASHCAIECDERLVNIFKRAFPDTDFVAKGQVTGEFDVQIPAGSLARIYRLNSDDFKGGRAYLTSSNGKLSDATSFLSSLPDELKIGVAWKTMNQGYNHEVSMPVRQLTAALSSHQLINLQYGDCAEDIAQLRDDNQSLLNEMPGLDLTNDIEGLLGLIQSLDLVVTVDNSIAVIAAALGKPTWILLPYVPHHMWGLEHEKSVWFNSASLFRQDNRRDWGTVLAQVTTELESYQAQSHEKLHP